MKLLALVFLLFYFSSPTLTEVVKSFEQSCPQFFIPNPDKPSDIIIPTVFPGWQYKKICQRWQGKFRFATVYDTVRRIPVYSAYTFSQEGETRRTKTWKIEPQLDDTKGSREMIDSPREAGSIYNQAVNSDYTGTGFTRGHVFPRMFAADQDQANSTFTLTNVAPQTPDSNQKWAEKVETLILKEINQTCELDPYQVYIVTGVVPGKDWISIRRDGREYPEGINIPSHFWSAYCCRNKKNPGKFITGAYITKQESFNLRRPNIHHLNIELTKLYNEKIPFNVFPGLHCVWYRSLRFQDPGTPKFGIYSPIN
ncbi:endonuclease domain-containing 1 protein-like [Tachysurus fulvidraco]|uniref:endonuclease domain-containing 1 protein-like n=1 Tax=Tachysurus fulvidraco TaxID=1234273 RepID=UPI001FED4320|nr:endonuclease domain-containing 1 protein-like [Tachysurus fulvidraco]XP_047669259.1 endonuclease domain-containing 1 protein-like [Tachysurus fulvidraco]